MAQTKIIFNFLLLLLIFNVLVYPQTNSQTVLTQDGRKVILKSDHTWEYQTDDRSNQKNDLTKAETISFMEVATDQINYLDKPLLVKGSIQLVSIYFGLFQNAENTHYAFNIQDAGQIGYLYMARGQKADELRKKIIANNGSLEGNFFLIITQKGYKANSMSIMVAELLDYEGSSPNSLTSSNTNSQNPILIENNPPTTPPKSLPNQNQNSSDNVFLGANGVVKVATSSEGGKFYVVDRSIKVGDKYSFFTYIAENDEKYEFFDAKVDCSLMGYMNLRFGEKYKGSNRPMEAFNVKNPKMVIPETNKVSYSIIEYVCKKSR